MVLADELFNRFDKDRDGKISYRGSLLRKSDATNFADILEKVLINLVHEVNGKPSPFPDVNPFANDNRRKREAETKESEIQTSKFGVATIREIPHSQIKINVNTQI